MNIRKYNKVRRSAIKYLAGFDLDSSKIGQLIDWGASMWVFGWGDGEVIKIPRRNLYTRSIGRTGMAALKRDLDILKNKMPEVLPKTFVVPAIKGKKYVILQQRIEGEYLKRENMGKVLDLIIKLYDLSSELWKKHHLAVDFLGLKGAKYLVSGKLVFSNLLTDGKNIYLVDTNLLEVTYQSNRQINPLLWINDLTTATINRVAMRIVLWIYEMS